MSLAPPAAWRDYRNRRRLLLAVLAIGPVFAAALAAAGASGPSADALHLAAIHLLAASWATGLVAALGWFAAFRCPFCARPFHWTWLVANPLSRECLHCGFAKWRDPAAARCYRAR